MKKNVEKRMPTNYMNFDSYDFLQDFNDDLHRFRSMTYLYGENYPNDYDKSIETPFETGHYHKKFQNFFAPFSNYWFSYFMLNVGLCFSVFLVATIVYNADYSGTHKARVKKHTSKTPLYLNVVWDYIPELEGEYTLKLIKKPRANYFCFKVCIIAFLTFTFFFFL